LESEKWTKINVQNWIFQKSLGNRFFIPAPEKIEMFFILFIKITTNHPHIMSSSRKLPIDIIKHILPYDKRFVLRNGEIISINKLDMNKYKHAILNLLLLRKPQVYSIKTMSAGTGEWDVHCVEFSNRFGIHYNVDYMGNKDTLVYTFGYNEEYCYSPIYTIDIL
jgi:hypothetical protein